MARRYKLAFLALGAFNRLEQPNHKVYLSFHARAIENYLRSIGKPGVTMRVQPLMCAVLAHGDIPFAGIPPTVPGGVGKALEIGISELSGRPASDHWRKVLATRQILGESQSVRVAVPERPAEINIVKSYVPSYGE